MIKFSLSLSAIFYQQNKKLRLTSPQIIPSSSKLTTPNLTSFWHYSIYKIHNKILLLRTLLSFYSSYNFCGYGCGRLAHTERSIWDDRRSSLRESAQVVLSLSQRQADSHNRLRARSLSAILSVIVLTKSEALAIYPYRRGTADALLSIVEFSIVYRGCGQAISMLDSFFGSIAETRFEKTPGKRVHRSQTATLSLRETASVLSVTRW
jgi:hypothetical protein